MFTKFFFTIIIASVVSIIAAKIDTKTRSVQKLSREYQKSTFIYPGTKWCGAGNTATNYDDLGEKKELDKCCREHDSCPDTMESGETKYNLTNSAMYTRLHCSCDEKFHKCLHAAESKEASSSTVGRIYFDGLDTKCYQYDRQIVGCAVERKNHRCEKYVLDDSSTQKWQWFDVPYY